MQRDAWSGRDQPPGESVRSPGEPKPPETEPATHPVFETTNRGEMKKMRRLRWFWVFYTGNLYACNRRYFGWISMRTAWQAATALVNAR